MTRSPRQVLVRLALLCSIVVPWSITPSQADPNDLDTLYFEFSKGQRSKYDQAVNDRSTAWFRLGIHMDMDAEPVPARAHLRGQGTLKYCPRKSFTIDMPGDRAGNLIPDSPANSYTLISMCQDENYLRTGSILRLWQSTGMFPIRFRYVELVINRESRGLYMLMEKPADVLPREEPGLLGLLRRRFTPPGTIAEVKYSSTNKTITAGDYVNSFLNLDHLDSQQFVDTIASRLNLDQFIRSLAVAAVLFNGDYVDEIWFLQKPDPDSSLGYRYEVMKWDPDDTLRRCHYGDTYAFQDPHGIAACAESELDNMVLGNPLLYPRFVTEVHRLLQNDLSVEKVTAEFDQTVNDLKKRLTNPDIIRHMEHFHDDSGAAVDLASAFKRIDQTRNQLVKFFRNHHRELTRKVLAFQQGE